MTNSIPPTPPNQFPLNYDSSAPLHRGTSGAAIASLVLGIMGCVPILTGALAVALAIVGLRKTRNPAVTGRGLAIAGLILGIISVTVWTGCGGYLAYGYHESKPAGVVAQQFLQDVSVGHINAALGNSQGISSAQLKTFNQQLTPYGTLQSASFTSFNIHTDFGGTTSMNLGGVASFASGVKNCTVTLTKQGATYKIAGFWVQ